MSAPADATPDTPDFDQPPPGAEPAETDALDQPPGSGPDPEGVAPRPVLPVELLTAHPGNVRRDLDLNPEFLASIAANGVLVPLRITRDGDGGYRVIDGHRRLAAASRAGLTEVPVDVAGERAGDEPGQFLDMWTAHRHRNPLQLIEEADALFAAKEAGATRARIRKATGLKPADVTAALTAARLTPGTRSALDEADRQLSLDQLAVVAEFEDDPQAVARLSAAATLGRFDHEAERLRCERADQAEHQRLRQELDAAGFGITDALPSDASLLAVLLQDGEELTGESHAGCPGRGVFFRHWDLTAPVHYCTDPAGHGHSFRYGDPAGTSAAGGSTPGSGSGERSGAPAGDPPGDPARKLVIQGNKAWKAAGQVRHRWLTENLLARRTAPRQVAPFIAVQLLTMPDPLRTGLGAAPHRAQFQQITGHPATRLRDSCATAAAGRLPLLMLGPIITCYELALAEGEGRNTWRTDRYSPCSRKTAAEYFTFLASLGYHLSAIEQAVADTTPYTGDPQPGDTLPPDTDTDTDADGETRPEAGTDTPAETDPDPAGEPAADASAGDEQAPG